MNKAMKIFCCECGCDINARLTNGGEIYPHRNDLKSLPFWKCDKCGNFVGCHHKTSKSTKPLGVIPTQAIKNKRKVIHAIMDPIWKKKLMSRGKVYAKLSSAIGRAYHTAEIRSIDEAEIVIKALRDIRLEVGMV